MTKSKSIFQTVFRVTFNSYLSMTWAFIGIARGVSDLYLKVRLGSKIQTNLPGKRKKSLEFW